MFYMSFVRKILEISSIMSDSRSSNNLIGKTSFEVLTVLISIEIPPTKN